MACPIPEQETIHYSIQVPKLLSYLSFSDFNAEVKGLDQVPKKDWPNVSVVFQTYRLMLLMWFGMLVVSLAAVYAWIRGTLFTTQDYTESYRRIGAVPSDRQPGWLDELRDGKVSLDRSGAAPHLRRALQDR